MKSLTLTFSSMGFNILRFSLYMLSLNCVSNQLKASETDSLFKSDMIINMELKADFSAIQSERTGKAESHEGELVYYNPNGETVKLSVKLIIRGHFRRDTANCDFPPLYVNFRKDEIKSTIFKNQNELKLVTPCMDEKDVIDEYLIYKMYNKVTDLSMNVRLVKVLYFDSNTKRKLFEKYSFFLEKEEHMADRNNLVVKNYILTPFDLNRDNFRKLSVFQYIIGNGDWYFTFNHNLVILQQKDSTLAPYAVPYDFDLSSFVNAYYAKSQMTIRTYKGLCYTKEEFEEVFKFYKEKRSEFESVINNMEYVSKNSKKRMIKYIDYFYNVIESSKLIKREFLDVCENSVDYKIIIK
jgi:hypothetical protein